MQHGRNLKWTTWAWNQTTLITACNTPDDLHVMNTYSRYSAAVAVRAWVCSKKEERGFCECVFGRVTHALSIKRIEGDQVARQLRATIVWRDNSGPESALSSLSLCFFCFLSPSLSHTHYKCTFGLPLSNPPQPPFSLAWAGTRSWQWAGALKKKGIWGGWDGEKGQKERVSRGSALAGEL